MKKYVWLGLITSVLMIAIGVCGSWLSPKPVEVSVYTVTAQTVRQTVTCTGILQPATDLLVYAQMPCIADGVEVGAGQHILRGDTLFTVDAEATREVLAGQGDVPSAEPSSAITAAVDGVISRIYAQAGTLLSVDQPVAVIQPDATVQVAVAIRERDLPLVQVGQPVVVSGSGFSSVYSGVLAGISPTAMEAGSSNIGVMVSGVVLLDVTAADASLRKGLSATAEVVVSEQPEQLVIPYDCVLQDEDGQEYVYCCDDRRAYRRNIQTGVELEDGVQVVEGLSVGDRLVADPTVLPESASAVLVTEEQP